VSSYVLELEEFAKEMGLSPTKVRRQLKAGMCKPAPRDVNPYRWTRADVEKYWADITLPEARKHHRKFIEATNQTEARTA
jgi:hypothetical protein